MRRAALAVAGLLVFLNLPLASPAAAATQQVMMQGYAFSPAALTVRVGDTVTWMQHDEAPHDVVTTSAPVAFRSPQLSAGQSWSYTFRQAGTYQYYCSVHPDMRASVTVLPAPTTAPPSTVPRTTPKTSPAPTAAAAVPVATTPPPTTSAAAAAPAAPATPAAGPPPAVPQATAATTATLDPMLLVAGLVTGIAVLCLLLLSSRRA
ncbi:cupredoxin family copper-binding protein [Amycolatopsis sp. DG1A-15b]|uniref:cupredoxin domain-containing protein n=1 Tax=Amycolatopsis sp. DG1A-15b TaxID=3052846 RepID=UPI00255BA551|nr:cupredoxin family copper-binding protein [Amycolatopsis sp. DG1A-15b]WIX90832.1 cupredoxin family copper-binding protein [Amycolatopsis sp. DG1A-15b]